MIRHEHVKRGIAIMSCKTCQENRFMTGERRGIIKELLSAAQLCSEVASDKPNVVARAKPVRFFFDAIPDHYPNI
jgi:hypothetical protein